MIRLCCRDGTLAMTLGLESPSPVPEDEREHHQTSDHNNYSSLPWVYCFDSEGRIRCEELKRKLCVCVELLFVMNIQ